MFGGVHGGRHPSVGGLWGARHVHSRAEGTPPAGAHALQQMQPARTERHHHREFAAPRRRTEQQQLQPQPARASPAINHKVPASMEATRESQEARDPPE